MEFLKNIFGDKALTFADFTAAIEANKDIKLVNLKEDQYVDKGKLTTKINELKIANDTITDLKGKLEEAGKVDVEGLQRKIREYEEAENTRKQNETAAKEIEALKNRFNPLKGDHKFLNEGTENWIFGEFKNALMLDENKGKSDADVYAAITKDKNIYENPNQKFVSPPVGDTNSSKKDENQIRAIMGLSKKE